MKRSITWRLTTDFRLESWRDSTDVAGSYDDIPDRDIYQQIINEMLNFAKGEGSTEQRERLCIYINDEGCPFPSDKFFQYILDYLKESDPYAIWFTPYKLEYNTGNKMRRRRFNPKYRLGQKVAYEHPRIKSQMRGIIDEIDGDVYYVRDFGGFSETMTPIQNEDILGVLDFQGYIIKDKPKRKKFLGLFNNPKSDRQKMEDLIDRYEYIESLLATQTRTKKEKRALIAGLCEIREQIKSLEVEGFGDFRLQTYTQKAILIML